MVHDVGKTLGARSPDSLFEAFFESASDSGPESLGSQYEAAMNGVVVVDRSHLTRVAARGADRVGFLHNMLSADIKSLAASHGREATVLTNKGKLVASLTVFSVDDHMLLESESVCSSSLVEALSRYIISEDVNLDPLQDEVSFSVEGPRASELLASVTKVPDAELNELDHLALRPGEPRITAWRQEPSPRFDVAAPAEHALALLDAARQHGATIAGPELARIRRIEAGRPQFGVDMDASHMPLEAGLDQAISFDKGCYIGQEYVVRLAHRGHLNRKLVGVRIDASAPPPVGAKLTSGDTEAGTLTSCAYSPTIGATVALGYVKSAFFEPGTELTVDGELNATVSALPFV